MTTGLLARHASWSAPLLLAPCAAALFGATVWWASGATPAPAGSGAAAGTSQAATAVGPAAAGRQRSTAARAREVNRQLQQGHRRAIRLEHRLRALRAESGHLHVTLPKIPGAVAPAPPLQPAPAPPPVNTVTGASG